MSILVLTQVWKLSRHSGTDLLMMLAIADFADDDGQAFPSVPKLAKKCRTTPRHANRILASLRDSGELLVRVNAGPGGANRYRIVLQQISTSTPDVRVTPDVHVTLTPTSSTPDVHVPIPLTPTSDEPSLNRQEPPERGAAPLAQPAPASTTKGKASRLPSNWVLPEEWATWAKDRRPDLDVELVAEMFANHWASMADSKACKTNWFATWKNWVLRERAQPGIGRADPMAPSDTFANMT